MKRLLLASLVVTTVVVAVGLDETKRALSRGAVEGAARLLRHLPRPARSRLVEALWDGDEGWEAVLASRIEILAR